MSQQCPNCQVENPDAARFCGACGATLAATMVQGNTVVAAQPPPPPSVGSNPPVSPAPAPQSPPVRQPTFRPDQGVGPGSSTHLMNQREHTIFVIDKSGSMAAPYNGQYTKIEAAIRANTTMVVTKAQIDDQDQIGIVAFESSAFPILPLSPIASRKRQIIEALRSLTCDDGTDINEGLKAARNMFDWSRNDVVRRIVLLTDGHGGDPLRTVGDLKSRGVVIDVIGVGADPSNVDEKLLKKVASTVDGELRYRFIKDQQTLVKHYTHIAGKTAISA